MRVRVGPRYHIGCRYVVSPEINVLRPFSIYSKTIYLQ